MNRWVDREMPYIKPEPSRVATAEGIKSFIDSRLKSGLDASLFFELNDEYLRIMIARKEAKRREDRDNRVTAADLQSRRGRSRSISR